MVCTADQPLHLTQILPFEAELVLATLMDSQLTADDIAAANTARRSARHDTKRTFSPPCLSESACSRAKAQIMRICCRAPQTRDRSPHVPSPWTHEGALCQLTEVPLRRQETWCEQACKARWLQLTLWAKLNCLEVPHWLPSACSGAWRPSYSFCSRAAGTSQCRSQPVRIRVRAA